MLVIRFYRTGKKNQPSFKIIVSDKRSSSKRVRFTEVVGFWNPLTKEKVLKQERIKYWISVGAKPSETVHNLLVSEKIIEGKKIPVHKKSKKKTPASAEASKEEAKPVAPEIKPAAPATPAPETKPAETLKPEPEAPKEEVKPAEEKKEEVAPAKEKK